MPPSQETLLEKDIANTNLNLDISENDPSTASKTPMSNNSLIVSKPPSGADKGNKASFLTLPIEIRLQIYDILLISREDNKKLKIWTKDRWAQSEILRTCRQIYHEGNSILYSQNEFHFQYVDTTLEFIKEVGLENFRSIRSLYIRVDSVSKQSELLGLFNILAEEENGVRVMEYTYGDSGGKLDFIRTIEKAQEIWRDYNEPFISWQDGRYRLSARITCPQ